MFCDDAKHINRNVRDTALNLAYVLPAYPRQVGKGLLGKPDPGARIPQIFAQDAPKHGIDWKRRRCPAALGGHVCRLRPLGPATQYLTPSRWRNGGADSARSAPLGRVQSLPPLIDRIGLWDMTT